MNSVSTIHNMGTAIDSIGGLSRLLTETPAAAALVGLVAALYYVVNYGLTFIPYAGTILGSLLFFFVLAAMYAITNHAAEHNEASLGAAVDLLADRWVSLFVMALLLGVLFVLVAFLFAILTVFVVLAGGVAAAGFGGTSGVALGVLITGVYLLLFLPIALFVQFFVPAIAIDRDGAIDAVGRSVDVVGKSPISAIGFTLLRWVIEWVPGLLGVLAAAAIGWDALIAVFEEFAAIADDPGAQPDPEIEFFELFLVQTDLMTLAAMVLLVLLGTVIGQVLRVIYTTSFYKDTLRRKEGTPQ